MNLFRKGLFFILLAVAIIAVGCGQSKDSHSDSDNEKDSGEAANQEEAAENRLRIALDAQPPNLDQPANTSTSGRDTSRLIFETLLTTDAEFKPVPMLAESVETEDNKTYVFKLREGIKFHNGKEMTAEDVIASMERWLTKSTITGSIFGDATWTAEDDYTVVLELKEASSLTLDTIATSKQAPAIMPKEVVEDAGEDFVNEYIGTGPYKFEDWKQDQYIHFTKYDEYQAVDKEADGLSGKKEALIDDIYFYIVPDTSTRLAGLQSGEYDFAYGIPYDSYELVTNDENLNAHITASGEQFLIFNTIEGPVSDFKLRQALNTAIDSEEIMNAAFPNPDLYTLKSGYMDDNLVTWKSDAGKEYYNINNQEKAKELLAESDYQGEELRLLSTRDYDHHYNTAVVIQEQLTRIGVNVKLEIVDWPTINSRQYEADTWDLYIMGFSTVSTPPQFLGLSPTWAAGIEDEHVHEQMRALELAPTIEEAKEIWDDLQLYAWEELLPVSTLGAYHGLYASQKNVEGIEAFSGPIFWNVTIE
ncbi:ABC transporter substrate-binding protein [Ornithinibacillus sp. 4-3]|uniref:ABC transporter substrate-binding protein n=1 Tax=Ornithinibacillus sp. 4-3 TaxID=3231488 RepID=A0AB39HMN8_9BACI